MNPAIDQSNATSSSQASTGAERPLTDLPNPGELSTVDWTENIVFWAKDSIAEWDARARDTMRKHPVLSLLAAFAFGSTAGRVATRR